MIKETEEEQSASFGVSGQRVRNAVSLDPREETKEETKESVVGRRDLF